jgi:O-methyltransferase domain/Dimerisation domain
MDHSDHLPLKPRAISLQPMKNELPLKKETQNRTTLKSPRASGAAPDLQPLLQVALGFMASKTMLSAVELGVFTELAKGPLNAEDARRELNLHPRSVRDFLDTLVALRLLERHDDLYANTPEADYYLDRNKSTYIGGLFEMANARLYSHWGSLTEALRTGESRNESTTDEGPFDDLYSTPEKLESFLKAMTGLSRHSGKAIAEKFPWDEFDTFADVGAAQGAAPVQIALAHPHLKGIGYDLPKVQPIFEKYAAQNGVGDRVRFQAGDFFKDPLPNVQVIVMGHILHDWNLEQKRMLIRKAYEALPEGGALIIYESLIDDDRRESAAGLLMSLNMLIETPGGFDYTGADCQGWLRDAGFRKTRVEHLAGADSMVIGIK